jgi:hypothetical protein
MAKLWAKSFEVQISAAAVRMQLAGASDQSKSFVGASACASRTVAHHSTARRQFPHLAAGPAALPAVWRIAWDRLGKQKCQAP